MTPTVTKLEVDPKAYYQAATNCFDAAASLFDSFTYIFGELNSYGMMAGRDEDGRAWATSYDQSARDAVAFYGQTYKTLRAYGTALNDLGFEHAKSDAAIKGTAQPERPADSASTATFGPYALPASAAGGTPQGLAQTAVDVLDAINCPLPDGNTDTLAKAADAWDRLGRVYQNTNAKDKITIAASLFDGVTSNDAIQVRDDLKTIETSIGELLNTCIQISKSCTDYKDAIQELRNQIKGFIEDIVKDAALDLAITIAASCLTAGIGGLIAGAKAVESARKWSGRIKDAVIAWRARKALQLKGLADDAAGALKRACQAVVDLFNRLKSGITNSKVGGRLFSRIGSRTNQEVLDSGDHLPMTPEYIEEIARRAGVDLEGVQVVIAKSPDDVRYYDSMQASASAHENSINLAPSAFADEESLVRNLIHERTHVEQFRDGRVGSSASVRELEDEAYAADAKGWEAYKAKHGIK
ncbi:eCIS core domain-containing protein [Nocardia asteroides]|uniref:WXG100-like domain-containing protein n=1 Tax=Nocardia asteroides TaxID=1824 RepID=UPI003407B6CF